MSDQMRLWTAYIIAQHEEKMKNPKKMEEASAEAGTKLRSIVRSKRQWSQRHTPECTCMR